jgi:hypothetical protein
MEENKRKAKYRRESCKAMLEYEQGKLNFRKCKYSSPLLQLED